MTPQVVFSQRVDLLEDERTAQELLKLVQAGQLGQEYDPNGESLAILIGRANRLDQRWRWDLVVELVRSGAFVSIHHFMIMLDNPQRVEQLLGAYIQGQGDGRARGYLLIELADVALSTGQLDTLEVVERTAQDLDFQLYDNGMGMFLCHLCGNRNTNAEELRQTLASLEVLAGKSGFDPNKTWAGRTALFYCTEAEIAQWLIERGADINARGPRHETIMKEAWKNQAQDQMFRTLIENGANLVDGPDMEQVRRANNDPLLPSYPYLLSAWKRKILGEGTWPGGEVDKAKAESEDQPVL